MAHKITTGDQPVEIFVNTWNRNFIPWWRLLPQSVSGAIKKRRGHQAFKEFAKKGMLPLGGAKGIPRHWLKKLAWKDRIIRIADKLYQTATIRKK